MNHGLLWVTTFVLGAVATLMTSFRLLAALLFPLFAVPLIVRGAHLVALSGLLTGFGAFWTFLITQAAAGGTLDNSTFWLAVAIVPLALGLASLAFVAWRELARGSAAPG